MAGGGKKTGTRAMTARTDSPVLRSGTKVTVKKRKRVQEVIEISSSYHNNNQTRNENDENEVSDDSKGYNKEESVQELRKEIKDVKDEIEEIRKTLKEFILKSAEDDKIRRSSINLLVG
ncbi:hypothetical protein SESBI_28015 [Sesbania bispinosa]|nr:hypothetical protein SESBI_28015 [Sesbania bispinosa]